MNAKMKCSNCGAEMSNLNFTWGKKYWLLMIPIMLLGFAPIIKMTFFKGDVTKDLVVSDVQRRSNGSVIDVVGLITNNGRRKWSGVQIEAEFFDSSGAFLDELSSHLGTEIQPGAKEHFKISLRQATDSNLMEEDTKMVVKIAGGHTSPF